MPGEVDDVEVVVGDRRRRTAAASPLRARASSPRSSRSVLALAQAIDHLHHAFGRGQVLGRILDREDPHRRILGRQITTRRRAHASRHDATERVDHQRRDRRRRTSSPTGGGARSRRPSAAGPCDRGRRAARRPGRPRNTSRSVRPRSTTAAAACRRVRPTPPLQRRNPSTESSSRCSSSRVERRVALPRDRRALDVEGDDELQWLLRRGNAARGRLIWSCTTRGWSTPCAARRARRLQSASRRMLK